MTQRATMEELKDFANKVREAGGGDPLDALMPAVPEDTSQCLIAKNLNFNCQVDGAIRDPKTNQWLWCMVLDSKETRNKIAAALKLRKRNIKYGDDDDDNDAYAVILPKNIAQVAIDFDRSGDILGSVLGGVSLSNLNDDDLIAGLEFLSDEERSLLREMAPYIQESASEARRIATLVNPDGSIVV